MTSECGDEEEDREASSDEKTLLQVAKSPMRQQIVFALVVLVYCKLLQGMDGSSGAAPLLSVPDLPPLLLRPVGNDWGDRGMAIAQLYTRNMLTKEGLSDRRSAAGHQKMVNIKLKYGANRPSPLPFITNWDASSYIERSCHGQPIKTMSLLQIGRGIVNWPTCEDGGVVTKATKYAVPKRDGSLTTDHIPAGIRKGVQLEDARCRCEDELGQAASDHVRDAVSPIQQWPYRRLNPSGALLSIAGAPVLST